jgi:hypothetical protein
MTGISLSSFSRPRRLEANSLKKLIESPLDWEVQIFDDGLKLSLVVLGDLATEDLLECRL